MDNEIVFENEYATIWHYPSKKIIHHKFKKFMPGEEFQTVMTKEAEALEKYSATKILSDDRENPVLKKDAMEWSAENYRPRVIKAGLTSWAIVLPEAAAGKVVMNKIIDEYASINITIKVYSDPDAAMAWLESI